MEGAAEVAQTVKALTGGLDGAVDSGSPAAVMGKEERKQAKKERKELRRKSEQEGLRKGYPTPRDQKSSDPIMRSSTL